MTVSVIIPCYNQGHFLAEAIGSVLAQDHPETEIIVVNDGSYDNTSEVASKFPAVICIDQENQGLSTARNNGFKKSTGKFIIFLDSDDKLSAGAIANGLKVLLASPDATFAYGRLRRIDVKGNVENIRREPESRENYYHDLLQRNYIPTPGMVVFRRSALEKFGLFNPRRSESADYDIYLRMSRCANIVSHQSIAVDRRMHGDNMSANAANMLVVTLKVHKSQWKYARHDSRLRAAYKDGGRNWRRFYGDQLIDQFANNFSQREWKKCCQQSWILIRQCKYRLWLKLKGGKS